MATTTASGDKVVRQTRQYHRYQPGKSQLILATFIMGAARTNLTQQVGYYDAANGIFLQLQNSTLNIVQRTSTSGSPVNTQIAQSAWNVDKFDGTGPSGLTLDITKTQILFIDMEWLGVGRVRVGFVIDGKIYVAHQFLNANVLTTVYQTTANLPVRYEIENTGVVTGTPTLGAICCSVISEGGFESGRGYTFAADRGTTVLSITTEVAVISIRPKATFNSIVNRGQIIPRQVAGYADTTGARFRVVYNPTLGGTPSWNSVNDSSIAEFDIAGTTATGGIILDTWYVNAGGSGNQAFPGATALGVLARLPLTLDAAGSNPIHLTLTATRIGGSGTCNVLGGMSWTELR
jgi:hypothetical protein